MNTDSKSESLSSLPGPHGPHSLSGPHGAGRLTADQRAFVLRWLDETESDRRLSIRDLARMIAAVPPLERALLRSLRSASMGRLNPSSTTHAVALLGLSLTRRLLRRFADAPERDVRSIDAR